MNLTAKVETAEYASKNSKVVVPALVISGHELPMDIETKVNDAISSFGRLKSMTHPVKVHRGTDKAGKNISILGIGTVDEKDYWQFFKQIADYFGLGIASTELPSYQSP